jgi:2-polyprenyl-6-methoxyphenol hydroxylase-like FAD-dependent oxidoreductase
MKRSEDLYNVVVIGAGTAGLVTAAGTTALGERVAMIEPGSARVSRAGDRGLAITDSFERLFRRDAETNTP